jgi:hypothetical protein
MRADQLFTRHPVPGPPSPVSHRLTIVHRQSSAAESILPPFQSSIFPTLQPSIFNFQPSNLEPKAFVPQTTNQEHTSITSNDTRKHPFLANESGQKIFVPGKKKNKIFFTQKSPPSVSRPPDRRGLPTEALYLASVESSTFNFQPKRSGVNFVRPSLPPSNCSWILKIQKQFNSNAQIPLPPTPLVPARPVPPKHQASLLPQLRSNGATRYRSSPYSACKCSNTRIIRLYPIFCPHSIGP